MALLQNRFSALQASDECLTDEVVLAQAWKKAQSYIRSTNSYADNFELDRSTISLSYNLDIWKKELSSRNINLTPLRLVPSPKTTEWLFNDTTSGYQNWEPKDGITSPLRPLAHVGIKEQTFFTALMMCFADIVETEQGDTATNFSTVHDKKVVNYGNRLYCQYDENDNACFPWGNTTLYSKYFTDYQKFLDRPDYFSRKVLLRKSPDEKVFQVSFDISKFYDCIDRTKLTQKLTELALQIPEEKRTTLTKLLSEFVSWAWKEGDEELYRDLCQKDSENLPLGVPQGLVAGGFLANVYLLAFDKELHNVIGNLVQSKHRVVDYCRYVDDVRMVIVSKESKQTVESDLVSYFNTQLEPLGLKLNDTKTSVDFFRAKRSGISSKLKRIQSKVSGPISDREIDEQLGHLEGLISLADHMQSQQKSNDSNPLSLVEGQNHDVRGDTLVRFAANKIHKLLKEKRSFYAQDIDANNIPIAGSWDFLQERLARKLIGCWTKDPSLSVLLKKGVELFPDICVVRPIIEQLKDVHNRNDKKQVHVAEYCLCELFRHASTLIHGREPWSFPAHADRSGMLEYLQLLANEVIDDESKFSLNVREQARFFLLVRNDSPLDTLSKEDKNFNFISKLLKGFRNIANDVSKEDFEINVLLAYQFAHDSQPVIRSVSCFFEKISKKKGGKTSSILTSTSLRPICETLAIQSLTLFHELISYSSNIDMRWVSHPNVKALVDKTCLYQNALAGDLVSDEHGIALLNILKRADNPFSQENAVIQLLIKALKQYDFLQPLDVSKTKVKCDNWSKIQGLKTELDFVGEIISDPQPLFPIPKWVEGNHIALYNVGVFVRTCLLGQLDWSSSRSFKQRGNTFTGLNTSHTKRLLGMMHSPESIGGESAAMSSWLSGLLFHLLQWPGMKNKGTEFKSIVDIPTLLDVLDKRLGEQKNMYCKLSQMPAYVEEVDLGWNKSKKNLHVVMVQSLMPLKADFTKYGLTLDHPKYRAKHRKHVASVAELILHKVHSQTTANEKRTDGIDLIIWPELAVHSEDTDILKRLSDKTGAIIFTGLNFIKQKGINGPNNVAKWIIPNKTANGRNFIERLQGKQHMMKDEKGHIQPWRPYQLFVELKHPAFPLEKGFTLTGSICFDSTDIKLSADLKYKSDAYLVSALNQDVSTFDSMIDALYYHMYQHVILVNCGEFGGSVAKAPYKEKYDKLITHVHGKEQVSISSFEMNMFDFRSIGKSYRSNKQIKTRPAGFNNV